MKNVTINTAASWGASFRSFQDGDIFRESNIDLQAGDLADRLGYLKAQSDASGKLAADQTWTGSNTFNTGTGTPKTIAITGDGDFNVERIRVATGTDGGSWDASTFIVKSAVEATFECIPLLFAGLAAESASVADASASLSSVLIHRVPALTANRVYTLPSGAAGQLAFIKRTRTADAFTVSLNDGGGTIAQISASAAGWVLAMCTTTTTWVVIAWGGTVTSISTTT